MADTKSSNERNSNKIRIRPESHDGSARFQSLVHEGAEHGEEECGRQAAPAWYMRILRVKVRNRASAGNEHRDSRCTIARHLWKPGAREPRVLLSPRLWASRTCQRQVCYMKRGKSNCHDAKGPAFGKESPMLEAAEEDGSRRRRPALTQENRHRAGSRIRER